MFHFRVHGSSSPALGVVCSAGGLARAVRSLVGLTLAGLLASGCGGSIPVKVAYDPSARFSEYRSFVMAQPNRAVRTDADSDPFVHQRLRQLVFEQLSARGFVAMGMDRAALVVFVTTGSRERVDVFYDQYYGGAYYGPYGYAGPGWSMGRANTIVVHEGLVVVDFVDRQKNAVVWRGTANLGSEKDYSDAELREAVSRILSRFPPASSEK